MIMGEEIPQKNRPKNHGRKGLKMTQPCREGRNSGVVWRSREVTWEGVFQFPALKRYRKAHNQNEKGPQVKSGSRVTKR